MEVADFLRPEIIIPVCVLMFFCLVFLLVGRNIGLRQGRRIEAAEWESGKLESVVKTRLRQSRAVLGGLVSEQIAPFLPGFPFDPGDCRFIGKPVDFIVFNGMNKENISEVIFLEVKSGTARTLNPREKMLREAIRARRVRWVQYNVP